MTDIEKYRQRRRTAETTNGLPSVAKTKRAKKLAKENKKPWRKSVLNIDGSILHILHTKKDRS